MEDDLIFLKTRMKNSTKNLRRQKKMKKNEDDLKKKY